MRPNADASAKYQTNKAAHLDYPTGLAEGWPIASGVIERTCRYLVADRMGITRAPWSVGGAEPVLKLGARARQRRPRRPPEVPSQPNNANTSTTFAVPKV